LEGHDFLKKGSVETSNHIEYLLVFEEMIEIKKMMHCNLISLLCCR